MRENCFKIKTYEKVLVLVEHMFNICKEDNDILNSIKRAKNSDYGR